MSDDKYGKLRVIKGEATPEAPQGEYKREAPPEGEAGAWDSGNPNKGGDYRSFAPSMGRAEQMATQQLREARQEAESLRRRLRESMEREQRRINESELASRFDQIASGIAAYEAAIDTLAATSPAFAPAGKALGIIVKLLSQEVYTLALHAASPRPCAMRDEIGGDGGDDAVGRMLRQMLGDDWNVVPLGRAETLTEDAIHRAMSDVYGDDGPNIG